MRKPGDITGQRFGTFVAVKQIGFSKKHGPYWKFKCNCGVNTNRFASFVIDSVRAGSTPSCRRCFINNRRKTNYQFNRNVYTPYLQRLWAQEKTLYSDDDLGQIEFEIREQFNLEFDGELLFSTTYAIASELWPNGMAIFINR